MNGLHVSSGTVLSMPLLSNVKRRSLRKGTHSCWECKRRKMRCVVDTNTRDSACRGCRHRGSACISQEVPEEVAFRTNDTDYTRNGSLTTASTSSRSYRDLSRASTLHEYDMTFALAAEESLEMISQRLYTALPSPEDTKKLYSAQPVPNIPVSSLMTMPYTILFQNDLETVPVLTNPVDSQWHPVLIARHMLMLAVSLQHLHPDIHPQIQELSETPQTISERLTRLVNHYVTSKDQMLGSIEALECILIESVYQANLGNLRRSWMTARRALSIAQLMGLGRPDSRAQYSVLDAERPNNQRSIWRRLIFLDRFLCVMLSLPAACPDSSWDSDTELSPSILKGERLERIHCKVASRILESNRTEFTASDRQTIQELDAELQKAARALPSRWWLVPHLNTTQADPQTVFWNTGRIFAQVLHYNLIYRLHLPFMFRSTPGDRTHEYSRITCINACREILARFIALRTFNGIASSCRITDFIALMAALTLLLSHLHVQGCSTENFLAHQYHTDRAMIEKVQETMAEVDQSKSDPLSVRSADLLHRLMTIDMYEDEGSPQSAETVSVHPGPDHIGGDDGKSVRVQIPYFGTIRIARDSKLGLSFQHSEMYAQGPAPTLGGQATVPPVTISSSQVPFEDVMQQEMYPGLAADLDDWAFQGVDLAFFDTIMQSTGNNNSSAGGG